MMEFSTNCKKTVKNLKTPRVFIVLWDLWQTYGLIPAEKNSPSNGIPKNTKQYRKSLFTKLTQYDILRAFYCSIQKNPKNLMKRIVFLFGLSIFIFNAAQSQWVSTYGGNGLGDNYMANAKGLCVAVDALGNSYVSGFSFDAVTDNDIVVIKYNNLGDTVWTRVYNGSGNSDDKGYCVTVDNSGSVYVAGCASISGQGYNVILLKYGANGEFLWSRSYNGSDGGEDKAFGIAVDALNNIYVTGYSTGAAANFDIITLKYNPEGNAVWTSRYNGPDNMDDKAFGVVLDNLNNVYVAGYSESVNGHRDIITIKYNQSGEQVWAERRDGSAHFNDEASCITADASGNVYVAGYSSLDSNNTNCIVLKYNTSGNLQWLNTFNGQGNSEDKAFGIAVDAVGSVYITGFATGITSGADYVTIKYNASGVQQWINLYNGTGNGEDKASAIGLLNDYVIVTGASWGTVNNHDYATVKYSNLAGTQLQVTRYTMSGVSEDMAKSIAVAPAVGKVFVTGFSELMMNAPVNPCFISTQSLQMGEKIEITNTEQTASDYTLHQNYPNPFNPTTTIKFDIVKASKVKLAVYDILGKEITVLVNEFMNAGKYEAVFTSTNIPSGTYFYVLTADGYRDVKKMTLVK
jgi:uncharacterized delta-60 repeat protein